MNKEELESLYMLSLDEKLSPLDKERLLTSLNDHPDWARSLSLHKKTRDLLLSRNKASFGPSFALRLVNKIQNTGIVIDRQIFGIFRKFQLVAIGLVVVLLILNVMFSDQLDLKSLFGLEQSISTPQEVEVPFDFSETLNNL